MTRVAMVTGAGSGIGAASAIALSAAGFELVLTGRTVSRLEEIADECQGNALVFPADVSNPQEVEELFDFTTKNSRRLDILFNNAGTGAPAKSLEELQPEEWMRVINVNLSGAFFCTRLAFQMMKNQEPHGGRIINNGSISAHVPRPWSAPYTASKHGITGLTRSTSLDGRPYDIVCSQIDIGNAVTDLTATMEKGVPQADGTLKPEPTMDVCHVAEAVLRIAELPLSANVQFMTIMASNMPYIGRG